MPTRGDEIRARYVITSPMFMSGADQSKAEIRAPSVKGALRFWYRATALARLGSWEAVREAEKRVFGSTDKGQAAFLLTVSTSNNLRSISPTEAKRVDEGQQHDRRSPTDTAGIEYLGYGVISGGKQLRVGIHQGGKFTVRLAFRPNARYCTEDLDDVRKALIALGLFGGLGARARRGFGSVCLESLTVNGAEQWSPPRTPAELVERIQSFLERDLAGRPSGEPEYTAFSQGVNWTVFGHEGDPRKLLNELGKRLMEYRGSERFADDARRVRALGREHPSRVVFGLPHNYYFKTDRKSYQVQGGDRSYQRRASPLFIHVHLCRGNNYTFAATVCKLPARFLPQGSRLRISTKSSPAQMVPVNVSYSHIDGFIDFLNSPGSRRPITGGRRGE